jgi:hypothetical protein
MVALVAVEQWWLLSGRGILGLIANTAELFVKTLKWALAELLV